MPQTITLEGRSWDICLDRPLGSAGGFGKVYEGTTEDGIPVAIKQLHLDAEDAAQRELRIAEDLRNKTYANVIATHASGEFNGRYYLVMDRAEGSLQDHLSQGALDEGEALAILGQIVNGLIEVEQIVHRDLKPPNVLKHDGQWKLADFGIAKFVEDATSTKTLKDCLSPFYAAPEQWNHETSTHATDVYALGCIAYAILTGFPPFSGNHEALRRAHERTPPPRLADVSSLTSALVLRCLAKSPRSRPVLLECQRLLSHAATQLHLQTRSPLADAAVRLEEHRAVKAAEASKARTAIRARHQLANDGCVELENLQSALFAYLESRVPSIEISRNSARLGDAVLSFELPFRRIDEEEFRKTNWDMASGACLAVTDGGRLQYSANIWFCDAERRGNYRLVEVVYEETPGLAKSQRKDRLWGVANLAELPKAVKAHSSVLALSQVAHVTQVGGQETDFFQRWEERLAAAVDTR